MCTPGRSRRVPCAGNSSRQPTTNYPARSPRAGRNSATRSRSRRLPRPASRPSARPQIRALREQAIDPLFAEHESRIVKLMGDGAIAEFASVVGAVVCAAEVQSGGPGEAMFWSTVLGTPGSRFAAVPRRACRERVGLSIFI